VATVASLALWTSYAVLQIRNWTWQHSTFDPLPPAPGTYSQPVSSPVLRLIWMGGVALAVLAVVLSGAGRTHRGKLVVTQVSLAGGGLVAGTISMGFTPSHFGFGGSYLGGPSVEFNIGVLTGAAAMAAFAALFIVAERQRRQQHIIDSRAG
jgi:hypothetical protein